MTDGLKKCVKTGQQINHLSQPPKCGKISEETEWDDKVMKKGKTVEAILLRVFVFSQFSPYIFTEKRPK